MTEPRQLLDTSLPYSQVQLVFECPLGEECEELQEGISQKDHEQFCNEDLSFNTLGGAYFVADDWQKARAGDILTMIDIRAFAELQEKLKIATDSLGFYAKDKTWHMKENGGMTDIAMDRGNNAREALKKIRGEGFNLAPHKDLSSPT